MLNLYNFYFDQILYLCYKFNMLGLECEFLFSFDLCSDALIKLLNNFALKWVNKSFINLIGTQKWRIPFREWTVWIWYGWISSSCYNCQWKVKTKRKVNVTFIMLYLFSISKITIYNFNIYEDCYRDGSLAWFLS